MTETKKKREPWNPLLCNYPDSKKVNCVSFEAETLFTRLLAKCDDNSNFDANSTLIMCKLFAERRKNGQVSERKITKWLQELKQNDLILLFSVKKEIYLHIKNCKKHLRKDINPDVRFPAYDAEKADLAIQDCNKSVSKVERERIENVSSNTNTNTNTDSNTNTKRSLSFDSDSDFIFRWLKDELDLTTKYQHNTFRKYARKVFVAKKQDKHLIARITDHLLDIKEKVKLGEYSELSAVKVMSSILKKETSHIQDPKRKGNS